MTRKPDNMFADMFANFGKALKLPQMDSDAVLEQHRKNLKALEESMRAASGGASAMLEQQRKMMEQALKEISDMASSMKEGGNPSDMIMRQGEFARRSFETTVRNFSELGQIAAKTGQDTASVIGERVRESVAEVRDLAEKAKKKD